MTTALIGSVVENEIRSFSTRRGNTLPLSNIFGSGVPGNIRLWAADRQMRLKRYCPASNRQPLDRRPGRGFLFTAQP
jgi:hypothetical protein